MDEIQVCDISNVKYFYFMQAECVLFAINASTNEVVTDENKLPENFNTKEVIYAK